MYKKGIYQLGFLALFVAACNNAEDNKEPAATAEPAKGSYAYDAAYLKKHTRKVVELSDESGAARLLLSADYQGRVMTSTSNGDSGISYGWLNYDLLAATAKNKHIHAVGGEERFWMGPEGGQYSIYFKAKDSFNLNNWQVPAIIDTLEYDVVSASKSSAVFAKKASLTNYSGTVFDISIERAINLLSKDKLQEALHTTIPTNVQMVGYATENRIVNIGAEDWKKEKGLLSIWLLGMFTPTPQTVVIIPFRPGRESRAAITDNYFGPVPAERLQVKDSILYFTCDGKYRSKIGIAPSIAKPIAGSFDFANNVLTVVIPSLERRGSYVNSKWEIQKEPYKGDVINSYNDGPTEDGSQMGPFYEIESSSPAKELKKGEQLEYKQVTCHLQGDYTTLKEIAKQLLGVNLDEIKK